MKLLKKYYILFLAISCGVLAYSFYNQIFTTNYSRSIKTFQGQFSQLENELNNRVSNQIDQLKKGVDADWNYNQKNDDIFVHIFRNDSLIFWNTNQLPVLSFSDIHFPTDGIQHFQNGWYYSKQAKFGEFIVCCTFLIKHDYAYQNKNLVNDYNPRLPLSFKSIISLEQESGYNILSNNKDFLFSIIPDENQTPSRHESITLMILIFASLIFWTIWLKRIIKGLPSYVQVIVPVAILLLRIASLKFEWFSFLEGLSVYDPSIYGSNVWFPNFFELQLNCLVIIYLLTEIKRRIPDRKIKYGKIFGFLLILSVILFWSFLVYLNKGIIENSSIPTEIEKPFSLNIYSTLAIGILGVLFFFLYRITGKIVSFCKIQAINAPRLSVIIFILTCIYVYYELMIGNTLLLSAIFPFPFFLIVIYQKYSIRNNELASGLLLLAAFALVIASNLRLFNHVKEIGERELLANQLVADRDIALEIEYGLTLEEIKKDGFVQKMLADAQSVSAVDFQKILERRYFDSFWERYEMEFSLFSKENHALIDNRKSDSTHLGELLGIIEKSGLPSEMDSSIFYISDYSNQFSYIIQQKFYNGDTLQGTLFCTLKSKKIPEEIGFPRLLISEEAKVFESLEAYSIAKYHKDNLITHYGKFNYPTKPDAFGKTFRKGFFDYDEYNHFMLMNSDNDFIVLSKKNYAPVELITSFSYLFSFFGILLLPIFFKSSNDRTVGRTLNLAMKIQGVLIGLVFLSLLAFGYGSGIFVRTQYNEYTNDVIREKLNSVETECKSKLGALEEMTITEDGDYAQFVLQKFAKVFFTDINLYDIKGNILASSRPKVFNIGLISEQMHPAAYKNLIYNNKNEFVHRENIGTLNYSSAYKPFFNNSGKLLGFINLQHFGQQQEFENQIEKFLVAIVNVFILLLAISIIFAIFISSWLTAPLRTLQESLVNVKFGSINERISYDKEDEIGSLVREYNLKLDELEFTAQQLARSERESAWREMAKQVAHEIKNPLTPMKLSVQQLLRTYNPEDPNSGEKLKKVAASLIEQIDALTTIANEFSSFAKMPLLSENKIELSGLVEGVKEVFELEGQTEIRIEKNQEEIWIMGDKDQFIRVFNNLIKNAIQAIPIDVDGLIIVHFNVGDQNVEIRVEDNGSGIPNEKISKIFVPYFTTKSTGTGLGLAMVKQIIENHKGTIDFESIPKAGTTFIIHLPLAK